MSTEVKEELEKIMLLNERSFDGQRHNLAAFRYGPSSVLITRRHYFIRFYLWNRLRDNEHFFVIELCLLFHLALLIWKSFFPSTCFVTLLYHLKPNGYCVYHRVWSCKILRYAHTVRMCLVWSWKERSLPCTSLTVLRVCHPRCVVN